MGEYGYRARGGVRRGGVHERVRNGEVLAIRRNFGVFWSLAFLFIHLFPFFCSKYYLSTDTNTNSKSKTNTATTIIALAAATGVRTIMLCLLHNSLVFSKSHLGVFICSPPRHMSRE